jgi:fructosamine-3-kinase
VNHFQEIELAIDQPVKKITPLHGGDVGQVYLVSTESGPPFVAKVDAGPEPCLDIEGYMLDYLFENSNLPVPQTIYTSSQLLVMSYISGESKFNPQTQVHAAELLAELHGRTASAFGFERPTLIGGLHQPNTRSDSWVTFFAEQRLIYMAAQGVSAGRLPLETARRVEKFAGNLHKWLEEPSQPALIHGDVWTTNVLAADGQISGFLDPAIYYASPEIELAFITLFNTFGEPFFRRYQELRPISPGFFTERRDIYNLYPLLVHVRLRLFGGGYVAGVNTILSRFGY